MNTILQAIANYSEPEVETQEGQTMTYKLTPEVCELLRMTPAALNSWLSRNERFKPKQRTPNGALLWTDAEVAAVQSARATPLPDTAWRKKIRA